MALSMIFKWPKRQANIPSNFTPTKFHDIEFGAVILIMIKFYEQTFPLVIGQIWKRAIGSQSHLGPEIFHFHYHK